MRKSTLRGDQGLRTWFNLGLRLNFWKIVHSIVRRPSFLWRHLVSFSEGDFCSSVSRIKELARDGIPAKVHAGAKAFVARHFCCCFRWLRGLRRSGRTMGNMGKVGNIYLAWFSFLKFQFFNKKKRRVIGHVYLPERMWFSFDHAHKFPLLSTYTH